MPAALHGNREAGSEGTTALPLPAAKTGRLDALLLSVSIATLAFLAIWRHVLAYAGRSETRYFEASAPHLGIFLALLADVAGVAAVLFFCFQLRHHARRSLRIAALGLIVFLAIFALWQLQIAVQSLLLRFEKWRWMVILLNATPWIVLSALSFHSWTFVKRALRTFFLILSPLFVLFALNGTWHYLTAGNSVVEGKAAGMLPVKRSPVRVIWIIFDELDNRILTSPDRPGCSCRNLTGWQARPCEEAT
jgi:hypothetical protein